MTRRGRRLGRSRRATRGCAGAAARTRSLGTARATRTRTARPATRARSSGDGHASACLRRCGSGARDSGSCRPRTTGSGRTRTGAGERRCGGSTKVAGRRQAWSRPCGGAGRRRGARLVTRGAAWGWLLRLADHVESAIGHRAHLCAQSPVIRRNIRGSEVARSDRQNARFAGISCWPELGARVIRVGEVPGSNPGAPIFSCKSATFLAPIYGVLVTAQATCGPRVESGEPQKSLQIRTNKSGRPDLNRGPHRPE